MLSLVPRYGFVGVSTGCLRGSGKPLDSRSWELGLLPTPSGLWWWFSLQLSGYGFFPGLVRACPLDLHSLVFSQRWGTCMQTSGVLYLYNSCLWEILPHKSSCFNLPSLPSCCCKSPGCLCSLAPAPASPRCLQVDNQACGRLVLLVSPSTGITAQCLSSHL